MVKVALCTAVLDLVARGEARLDERVAPPGAPVAASPAAACCASSTSSASRCATSSSLPIAVSDNVATNALYERLGGAGALNGYLDGIGLPQTRMLVPIDFAAHRRRRPDGHAIGETTPREQTRLLAACSSATSC